jgi:hypothetical protein
MDATTTAPACADTHSTGSRTGLFVCDLEMASDMDADWTPASWTAPLDEASLEHMHGRGHEAMGFVGFLPAERAVKCLRVGMALDRLVVDMVLVF